MRPGTAAAIACALLAALAGVEARQTPMFSARVEAVRVDVLVTDRAQPVRGLRPSDFEVLDNGVAQQVDLAAFDSIPLNLVLAFDTSSSMAGDRLSQLKAAGRAVVDGLAEGDRTGLVTFSHLVNVRGALTADRALALRALDLASALGETSLVDAVHAAIILGESDVGRGLVILFSDGVDTTSWLKPAAVLRTARRTDAVVYAVSATAPGTTPDFLKDLCEATGGRLLEVVSTDQLTPVLLQVLKEFRERYVVSYSPRGVSRDGWHTLQVRVKNRRYSVTARPGYLAGPPS
jgi:Ca-activated chloride channel homolog